MNGRSDPRRLVRSNLLRRAFTLIELLFLVACVATLAAISVPNFLEAQVRCKIARSQCDMAVLNAALRAYGAQWDAYPPNRPDRALLLREFARQSGPPPTSALAAEPAAKGGPRVSVQGMRAGAGATAGGGAPAWQRARGGAALKADRGQPPEREAPLSMLLHAGWDLKALTTPVAWLSQSLPSDPFGVAEEISWNRHEELPPFVYVNLEDAFAGQPAGARRSGGYVLLSPGPDRELSLANPALGPFIEYDATNGTMSCGDLIVRGR